MHSPARPWSLLFALLAASLSACSGSSSSDEATVTLAVTDAATEELSTFVIVLESVELVGGITPISLLQRPTAVDFAALGDISRILNVTSVPPDIYTGLEVTLVFDNNAEAIINESTSADLLDASTGAQLSGPLTTTIDFPVPFQVSSSDSILELDLDLNQSLDVDSVANEIYFDPTLLPRVNPTIVKEHAIGGNLRGVSLAQDRFRIGIEDDPGDPVTVVTVAVNSSTVCQLDGVCLVGLAGLSAIEGLPPMSWVQAFGTMNNGVFDAATIEVGTGSYNGGTDILDGVVIGVNGSEFVVRGHSNNSAHNDPRFNLNNTVATDPGNTKVVRRGLPDQYNTGEINIGTNIRMFGLRGMGPTNPFDVTTPTDVVRIEPSHVFGIAVGPPLNNKLTIDVERVNLRDVSLFNWSDGGPTPPDPDNLVISDPSNFAGGQVIMAGTPIQAVGHFTPFSDSGDDFVATSLVNRNSLPSVLLIRDRTNGLTVTPTLSSTSMDFAFSGAAAGREKAIVDQGFVGEADVTVPGISVVPGPLGLGLFMLRDRTLNTISLYFTFAAFSQGLSDALGSATLFNFSAAGLYDAVGGEITSALAGAIVQ